MKRSTDILTWIVQTTLYTVKYAEQALQNVDKNGTNTKAICMPPFGTRIQDQRSLDIRKLQPRNISLVGNATKLHINDTMMMLSLKVNFQLPGSNYTSNHSLASAWECKHIVQPYTRISLRRPATASSSMWIVATPHVSIYIGSSMPQFEDILWWLHLKHIPHDFLCCRLGAILTEQVPRLENELVLACL